MISYLLPVLVVIAILSVSVTATDYCTSSPCLQGSCFNTGQSYECTCPTNYLGPRCQMVADSCQNNDCEHGECEHVSIGTYQCNCDDGWIGQNCGTAIDECSSNPCQNGGTCVDRVGGYVCQCTPDFAGLHCETTSKNLAVHFRSSYGTSSTAYGGDPAYAFDSIRTNHHLDSVCSPNKCCSVTGSETNPWWEITLNDTFPIRHIKIWNRTNSNLGSKLRLLSVHVDGQLCAYYQRANAGTKIVNLYCPEGMTGSTIRISKENHRTLSMCEVEIYSYIGNFNLTEIL